MIKLTVQNDNLFSHVLHQSFLILVFKLLTTNQFSDKFGYIPTVQLKNVFTDAAFKTENYTFSLENFSSTPQKDSQCNSLNEDVLNQLILVNFQIFFLR